MQPEMQREQAADELRARLVARLARDGVTSWRDELLAVPRHTRGRCCGSRCAGTARPTGT